MILSTDIDEILNNLVEVVLEQYNKDSGDSLTVDQITTYNIADFTMAGYDISKYFSSDYTYEHMKWDVQWIADIIDNNEFDVYFTTSTTPENCERKFGALAKAIALASSQSTDVIYDYVRSHFIRMENKQLIRADIIIDDCLDNLQLWNDKVYNIILSKPWNARWAHQYNVKHRNNSVLICDTTNDIVTCLDAIRGDTATTNSTRKGANR